LVVGSFEERSGSFVVERGADFGLTAFGLGGEEGGKR